MPRKTQEVEHGGQVQEEGMQGVRQSLLPPFPVQRRHGGLVRTQLLREGLPASCGESMWSGWEASRPGRPARP